MGTVGINFGSATGGAGFDVASTVTAIQAAQRSVENPWNAQLTTLAAQDTALSSIGTDLSTLSTALQKLTDFAGVTAQKNGSSSDTTQLALTGATSLASAGSHTVVINNLAQTSSNYSNTAIASTDTLSGKITIKVGSAAAQDITVVPGTSDTLSSLAAAINLQSVGVSASIITGANGPQLSLVSKTSGQAGQLTITGTLTDTTTSTAVGYHQGEPGTDAYLVVDGVPVTSASNTVSAAIPGVTFQLLAGPVAPATSGTPVQVQITNDTASVSTAISALVTAYNAVAKDLKTQEGKDASGNAQPLYGSPILAQIQNQLSAAIYNGGPSGTIKNVSQFGISFNNDGTLALNTDTLTTALTSHYSDIVGFLQNTNSFGTSFSTTLSQLGSSSVTGALYVAQQQNSSQETSFKKNITDEEARLATQKVALTAELNLANEILQAIPSQLNQINEIYSAVTGYSKVSG